MSSADLPAIPQHTAKEFFQKRKKYCALIVCWNEGLRLERQLERMRPFTEFVDIVIADGDSNDGSTRDEVMIRQNVRTLLSTKEPGLGTATRLGYFYTVEQGYEGIITVDGNGKDGVEAIPDFIQKFEEGFDLIQGSRFMKGGVHKNTPLRRNIGIRFVMAPILFLGCGKFYTDPTNAFRGCSRRFLTDSRLLPFRAVFKDFALHYYLNYSAAKLGFNVTEIPVVRVYPDDGSVPTKIIGFRRNFLNLWEMILTACGYYSLSEIEPRS